MRRRILAWAGLSALWLAAGDCLPVALAAGTGHLDPARDLDAEARAAASRGGPLILFFSRDGCTWCDRLRREQLLTLATGATPLLIREIAIDEARPLIDFSGRRTTSADFARSRRISLAPTLAFFGPDGTPLADPIVGYRLPDFYGAYLDQSIEESRRKLAR